LLNADLIITASNKLAEKIGFFIPEFHGRIMAVYNPLPQVGSYVMPLDNGKLTLLYTGGSAYEKGIFHLLRILKLLVREFNNLELIIANGQGSLTLRHVINKYGLASNVKLLPRINHDEVLQLLNQTHAAVVPSIGSECLPYAVIEPMVVGRAVFASPVGGIPEILRNGFGGYFIDPCNSSKSAGVLAKIVNLDEIVRQGKYAKEHITRLLTYENTSGRLLNVLAEIA
jgi:glycosyltransferase involved in cell wall biosynthesis